MALINLKTDLKSLRFGKDRPGGDSSNQPYIQAPIPEERTSNSQDFILRGGTRIARTVLEDLTRFSKFFTDLKSSAGTFFVAKQELLTSKQIKYPEDIKPTRYYNPANLIAQLGVNQEGIHLMKQGDTLVLDSKDTYISKVKDRYNADTTNKLTLLRDSQLLKKQVSDPGYGLSNTSGILFEYNGGPNSSMELSKTVIKRVYNTLDSEKPNQNTLLYSEISEAEVVGSSTSTVILQDFRSKISKRDPKIPSTDYTKFNRNTYGIGDPGKRGVDRSNPIVGLDKGAGTVDLINLKPLYTRSEESKNNLPEDIIPFNIKVISNIKPSKNVNIKFRAYISNLSDTYSADFKNHTYSGRGERFYTYQGFNREMGFNLQIHAGSRQELPILFDKLNFLVSTVAPDYTGGFMKGNFISLTIGDYIQNQLGILTGLTVNIPDTSPWEINRDALGNIDKSRRSRPPYYISDILPHYVEVTGFRFIPISNDYVPLSIALDRDLRSPRFVAQNVNLNL